MIEKESWADYVRKLAIVVGSDIGSFVDLVDALKTRMAFFHANGCRLSDHGSEQVCS
ncbi:MAG: glucuronate isomerase [Bacteroidia bacterium]